jgi:hypothetical protein
MTADNVQEGFMAQKHDPEVKQTPGPTAAVICDKSKIVVSAPL